MNAPRLLPLIAVAVGGVLLVKGLASVEALPKAFATAQAFAEGTLAPAKDAKADADAKMTPLPAAKPPAPVCAPTAAQLAKEAGLSPAELQILQSLQTRRGQLDSRETDMETQIALMAAAEAKLDAKVKGMQAIRAEIQGMLGQADAQKQTDLARLVTVYQAMKPRDAAARFTLLSDEVRLPIAAKMKERPLSAILAQMPAPDAKALTEKLAARYDPRLMAAARAASSSAQPANATVPSAAIPQTPALKPSTGLASADPLAEAASAPKPAAAKAAPAKVAKAPVRKPKPKAAPAKAKPPAPKTEAVATSSGPKPYASLKSEDKPAAPAPAAKAPEPAAAKPAS